MDEETLLGRIKRFNDNYFELYWPGEEDLDDMHQDLKRIIRDAEAES